MTHRLYELISKFEKQLIDEKLHDDYDTCLQLALMRYLANDIRNSEIKDILLPAITEAQYKLFDLEEA